MQYRRQVALIHLPPGPLLTHHSVRESIKAGVPELADIITVTTSAYTSTLSYRVILKKCPEFYTFISLYCGLKPGAMGLACLVGCMSHDKSIPGGGDVE